MPSSDQYPLLKMLFRKLSEEKTNLRIYGETHRSLLIFEMGLVFRSQLSKYKEQLAVTNL